MKDNTGHLSRNDNSKIDVPYTGSATIDGVEYWINAWVNGDKAKGEKQWFRMIFKPKQLVEKPAPRQQYDLDDEIPF